MRAVRKPLHAVRSLAAVLMVAASFAAGAANVWLSGPSAISLGESAVFTGAKLSPRAFVVVFVTEPSGYRHGHTVAVSAKGTVSHEFIATSRGVYTFEIASQSGNILGTATLVVV
jgi:hypothetical protein